MRLTMSRQVADDLSGAYEAYLETAEDADVCDDSEETKERAKQIKSILDAALTAKGNHISIEVTAEQKADIFDEVENRFDIADGWADDTRGTHEHKAAKALVAGYKRLLLQEDNDG